MAITLSKLYRDIVSGIGAPEDQIRKLDVTNLINQNIADLRVQFIKQGLGKEFIETETISSTSKDTTYPFLYTATITKPLMRSLPIEWTVQQSLFWETSNELQDTVDTWTKGDLAIKDGVVYEALSDINSQNTYDLTFKIDNVKNYYNNNGLEFKKGDIVYNQSDGTYWRCTSDYTNDQGQTISASGSFEQLYWRQIDDGYQQGTPIKFTELFQTVLHDYADNHFPFTIKEKDFYTTKSNTPITISYVPEWQYVEDLSANLDIPDMIIQPIRNRCIRLIGSKLGIKEELLPNVQKEIFPNSQEDE